MDAIKLNAPLYQPTAIASLSLQTPATTFAPGDRMVAAASVTASHDDFLSGLDAILTDPNMSVEDKIAALLMKLMDKMDGDIQKQLDQVRSLQSGTGGSAAQGQSVDTATFELQRMASRRNQLFETLNAIVERYQKSAEGVIRTLSNG